jgi:hypothetical protein
VARKQSDDDPEIPDWSEREGYEELWALDLSLRQRPESTSRHQRRMEDWD